MTDDMDFAIDSIKEFLDSPGASEKIQSLLGAFGAGGEEPPKSSQKDHSPAIPGDIPIESIMKIAAAYKNMSREDDSRINLLRAIKPYVKKNRSESVETAIKLLSLMRLAPLLGDIREVL